MKTDLTLKDRKLVEEISESNSIGDFAGIAPWFKPERDEIAVLFYLIDLALRYDVSNPTIQIKGAGLIGFDQKTWMKKPHLNAKKY